MFRHSATLGQILEPVFSKNLKDDDTEHFWMSLSLSLYSACWDTIKKKLVKCQNFILTELPLQTSVSVLGCFVMDVQKVVDSFF